MNLSSGFGLDEASCDVLADALAEVDHPDAGALPALLAELPPPDEDDDEGFLDWLDARRPQRARQRQAGRRRKAARAARRRNRR
jgi:hypothetical protein